MEQPGDAHLRPRRQDGPIRRLWRSFTCGYLTELLEVEYPDINLPFVIRRRDGDSSTNAYLDEHFTFVGVVYWGKLPELMGRIIRNPIESDPQAFAQVRVFVSTARLVWARRGGSPCNRIPIGGVPGQYPDLPGPEAPEPGDEDSPEWQVGTAVGADQLGPPQSALDLPTRADDAVGPEYRSFDPPAAAGIFGRRHRVSRTVRREPRGYRTNQPALRQGTVSIFAWRSVEKQDCLPSGT